MHDICGLYQYSNYAAVCSLQLNAWSVSPYFDKNSVLFLVFEVPIPSLLINYLCQEYGFAVLNLVVAGGGS